ncbi:alpha/beta hydrolase [Microlunatus sp. GCM10028923]|uniref:alpha/beta hydrolase n=1 Tax=Microlunatus sp. GCM10028923 TaxID=3273400 RepID=UPI003609F0A0
MPRHPLLILFALFALTLGGPVRAAAAEPPVGELDWQDCASGAGLRCAELEVPVDWAEPRGARTRIGLAQLPAQDPDRRLGSLVVNLGGPGSSIEHLPTTKEQLRDLTAWYDVIVVDPRGIGASSPVACPPAPAFARVLYAVDRRSWQDFAAENRRWAEDCLEAAGPLAGHLDAGQVARDLDAVRAALGVPTLNYYGNSYGTVYGQRYADLFPERVGRMFLDSVADHTDPSVLRRAAPMAAIHHDRFQRFRAWCRASADCALSGRDPGPVFDALMERAEQEPLPAPSAGPGRTVTADALRLKALGSIDGEAEWPEFAAALAEAEAGDAGSLWLPPPTQSAGAVENLAFCSDFPFRDGWPTLTRRIERPLRAIAPHTGWLSARTWYGRCAGQPGQGSNPPHPITAPGVAPILLHNGAEDDTTPPAGGRNVARQLPGAVWFTGAAGHAAYLSGDRCVRDLAHAYLTTGRLPAAGHRCPADG